MPNASASLVPFVELPVLLADPWALVLPGHFSSWGHEVALLQCSSGLGQLGKVLGKCAL